MTEQRRSDSCSVSVNKRGRCNYIALREKKRPSAWERGCCPCVREKVESLSRVDGACSPTGDQHDEDSDVDDGVRAVFSC